MIKLRTYQQPFFDDIIDMLYNQNINSLCCALPTGGGKSVIIGKLANIIPGRTLILTHRIEILQQNSDWLSNAGCLSSNINTLKYDNKDSTAGKRTQQTSGSRSHEGLWR